MGGVDMERHLGVGLTPPTLNHQEKPPDTQSTSGGVGGGRGRPRPLSRLVAPVPFDSSVGATCPTHPHDVSCIVGVTPDDTGAEPCWETPVRLIYRARTNYDQTSFK